MTTIFKSDKISNNGENDMVTISKIFLKIFTIIREL